VNSAAANSTNCSDQEPDGAAAENLSLPGRYSTQRTEDTTRYARDDSIAKALSGIPPRHHGRFGAGACVGAVVGIVAVVGGAVVCDDVTLFDATRVGGRCPTPKAKPNARKITRHARPEINPRKRVRSAASYGSR
jgi:hypothetical protein